MEIDVLSRVRHALNSVGIVASGTDMDPGEAAPLWAAVLEVAAEQLAATTHAPGDWSEQTRTRVIEHVGRATRVAMAAKAPVLLAQERSGTWRRPGVRSFETHRTHS